MSPCLACRLGMASFSPVKLSLMWSRLFRSCKFRRGQKFRQPVRRARKNHQPRHYDELSCPVHHHHLPTLRSPPRQSRCRDRGRRHSSLLLKIKTISPQTFLSQSHCPNLNLCCQSLELGLPQSLSVSPSDQGPQIHRCFAPLQLSHPKLALSS